MSKERRKVRAQVYMVLEELSDQHGAARQNGDAYAATPAPAENARGGQRGPPGSAAQACRRAMSVPIAEALVFPIRSPGKGPPPKSVDL